ncbi:hypothetical protein, variant [Aphanomyces invadans]|uniref:Uncharacterized protein n=1 Tax=Aphanomyces invadans TaxID=157072 RepID=A0A024TC58_9STRA|nr:hypothetical protein, variant [Aphanomyces invadans]ETV91745.1 hypothetical protein, variant [Aphanomyces invadans]|eukprot:XP_008879671.1 hypothetical protein, variant [Aphanomyces invadans]
MTPPTADTQHPLRVLEHKVPFRNLVVGLFLLYAVSFAITWSRVWWNTAVGIAVAAFGLLWLAYPTVKGGIFLELYYYCSFGTILLHVFTAGFLGYDLVVSDLHAALGRSEDPRSLWGVSTALILVVSAQAVHSVPSAFGIPGTF